jgi:hypothetical protein
MGVFEMRKRLFTFVFIFFVVLLSLGLAEQEVDESASDQNLAQTRKFASYDKVEWGASVEDVKNAYSRDNIILEEGTINETIILIQKSVPKTIEQRTFLFGKVNESRYSKIQL